MNHQSNFSVRIFFLLFAAVILVNFAIFQGLFHAIAFAAIISGSFYPLFERLQKRFPKREQASVITTFVICLCLILPMIYMISQLAQEVAVFVSDLRQELTRDEINNFFFGDGIVGQFIRYLNKTFELNIDLTQLQSEVLSFAEKITGKAVGTINSWLSRTLSFLFQFIIMIVASYAFFVEGPNLKKFMFRLNPLPDDQEQMILDRFSQMNYVTLICNGVGGLIQGVLAGVGLWVCGIQSVFLWTTIMIVLAFIPLLGISLVTIPVTIYLFLTGSKAAAIAFFLYTSGVALYVENVFKPKFIGKRIKVNSILLLLYIIAGMGTFGMAGIFYGPILCILFLTMVEIFHKHYLPSLER